MKFKTSVSKVQKEDINIRGKSLRTLIGKKRFSDVIFLLLLGREPDVGESRIFEALLVSMVDHGMGTTSSMTTRFVASGGNPLNAAVAAGVLAQGNYHGGAIEKAMEQLEYCLRSGISAQDYVQHMLGEKKVLFGFGHKVYTSEDPRVTALISVLHEEKFTSKYVTFALELADCMREKKGICLNIDGLAAALLLQLGFHKTHGKGVFVISRIAGLVAQAVEEYEHEKPVRRIAEEDIEYIH